MSILSPDFLVFVAALALVYYALNLRCRKWALLAGSAVFWYISGVWGTVYLLAETGVIWGAACLIGARREAGKGFRTLLSAALILVLTGLFLFKDQLLGAVTAALSLVTPLGISYFTFQSMAYLIDVSRGKAAAERNYLKVLLFCGFFPQLSQGPIGVWKDLQPQLDMPHRFEPQLFDEAVFLMAWGFFKKLVIADRIAPFVREAVAQSATIPGWLALLAVAAYTLELYADFSGGIDIVRGAAELFGIRLSENFRQPFFAVSVADYWRRWHISLGAWFRSYVLYPLATSRISVKIGKAGRALLGGKAGSGLPGALSAFAVFVLIGLWHAFQWNALFYGVWFGLLSLLAVLLEPAFKGWKKKLRITGRTRWFRVWGLVRTWMAVLFAQFFACTASPKQAFELMGRITAHFSWRSVGNMSTVPGMTFDPAECIVTVAALLVLLVIDLLCEHRKNFLAQVSASRLYIRWPVLMLLMLAVLVFGKYGVGSDASAFVYAGF